MINSYRYLCNLFVLSTVVFDRPFTRESHSNKPKDQEIYHRQMMMMMPSIY